MKRGKALIAVLVLVLFQTNVLLAQENWSLKWENTGDYSVWKVEYSPDGEKILVNHNNYDLKLFNANDGTLIWSKTSASGGGSFPKFFPDGNKICYVA